jgi:hypothetical protein
MPPGFKMLHFYIRRKSHESTACEWFGYKSNLEKQQFRLLLTLAVIKFDEPKTREQIRLSLLSTCTDYEVKTAIGPISLRGTAWAMLELAARVQVIWSGEFFSYFPVSLLITCFTHTGFANVLFGVIFLYLHHKYPLPFKMTRELFHNFWRTRLCVLKIPYFLLFLGSL